MRRLLRFSFVQGLVCGGGLLSRHSCHTQNGDTALICAAYHRQIDCVRLLLLSGAEMDAQAVDVCFCDALSSMSSI